MAIASIRAQAPAKIIITGEHSVVYGKRALAMAVDRYAYVEVAPLAAGNIAFDLRDLRHTASSTFQALRHLKESVLQSYSQFLRGELGIRQVLRKPGELLQYAFVSMLDALQIPLAKGLNISIHSDIPMGCGMGSSAAAIVCLLSALVHHLKLPIKAEWLHSLSMEIEKLQHGKSSGIDTYMSLHGGMVRFQNGVAERISSSSASFMLVNTGSPLTSTGESVSHVANNFATASIWDEFDAIAAALENSLSLSYRKEVKELIRHNHQLLVQIGVVPPKVQHFVAEVEARGDAAKICGAGAVGGDNAGVVLLAVEEAPYELIEKYGYTLIPINEELQGARII